MTDRCPVCMKWGVDCDCGTLCQRCLSSKCACEKSLRPELEIASSAHLQPDEDLTDNLRRDYGTDEEKSREYWHGYNYAKKVPRKLLIKCPYFTTEDRKAFYRGVSDFRSSMR